MACAQRPAPSRWRDFSFAFKQVVRAIEPHLPLADMIGGWNGIAHDLAEPPRERVPQIERYFPS